MIHNIADTKPEKNLQRCNVYDIFQQKWVYAHWITNENAFIDLEGNTPPLNVKYWTEEPPAPEFLNVKTESDTLAEAYTDRNLTAQLLAAVLVYCGAKGLGIKVDDPEWPLLFIDLPSGQVSWHIPKKELVIELEPYTKVWDKHTLNDKIDRIKKGIISFSKPKKQTKYCNNPNCKRPLKNAPSRRKYYCNACYMYYHKYKRHRPKRLAMGDKTNGWCIKCGYKIILTDEDIVNGNMYNKCFKCRNEEEEEEVLY